MHLLVELWVELSKQIVLANMFIFLSLQFFYLNLFKYIIYKCINYIGILQPYHNKFVNVYIMNRLVSVILCNNNS